MSAPASPLISAAELVALLDARAPELTLIDGTWTFDAGPQPRVTGRLPGAVAFDIDAVAVQDTDLPHMLPPPTEFEAHARALGVDAASDIVVYDRIGLFSAPRVWWSFRAMGHRRVRVLDGGLPAWIAAGGAVEAEPALARAISAGDFRAAPDPALIRDRAAVAAACAAGGPSILDVRSAARFAGDAPEPRAGLPCGHMPGARNLPWETLLAPDGTLAPPEVLRDRFAAVGVALDGPVITTCGSGVTAAFAALALERAGARDWSVYDGSWAEWGAAADAPIATGAP